MCKHSNGMAYILGRVEVTSEVRSVPLGQKRKRGRPKKLPNCLTRSPPVQVQCTNPVPVDVPDYDCEVEAESTSEQAVEPSSVPCDDQSHYLVVEASPALISRVQRKRGRGGAIITTTPPSKCPYELLREENIREREAVLESLNIEDDIGSCNEELPPKSSKRGRGTKRKNVEPATTTLRSRK